MSINNSQNNNNNGNGIQENNITNNNYSQKLEETKSDLSKEQKDCVDELNIIDSTKREGTKKPSFVSRFTIAWNKIHELLITVGRLLSDTKSIFTIFEGIKELIEGFWK